MTVSAAKLEANRRNSQKSTGPRTEVGKTNSSQNAVTHGLRAKTLVLLDEDPQVLDDRRTAWRGCLAPRDEVELSVVDDAVEYSWMQDRARRAQAARLASNIASAGDDQAIREADQVLCLGQKLFADRRGPLADYPHNDLGIDSVRRVSYSDLLDDPEDPPRLVLHLQATTGGCQWMLDQWADLRSILEDGLNWQSVDKLKAVRLLGRQPLEAVDDRNVLLIFIACQRIEGQPIDTIPEIWKELNIGEKKRYAERLRGRGVDRLAPVDAAAARQVLFDIIDRATAPIRVKAEAHRRRAETVDALTADRLLFDDSPEGERLRRYELANGRAKARALNELRIRQRSPLFVVSDKLPVVGGQLPVVSGQLPVVSGQLPVVSGQLSVASGSAEVMTGAIAPNEPTGQLGNAPNEPTEQWKNAPNEPTVVAVGEASTVREWTAGASDDHEREVGLGASTDAGGALETVVTEEPFEPFDEALKKIRRTKEEHTPQWNETAQKQAAVARAAHSARGPEPTYTYRNPGHQPRRRAAATGPRRKNEPAAPQITNLDDLLKSSLALLASLEKHHAAPS